MLFHSHWRRWLACYQRFVLYFILFWSVECLMQGIRLFGLLEAVSLFLSLTSTLTLSLSLSFTLSLAFSITSPFMFIHHANISVYVATMKNAKGLTNRTAYWKSHCVTLARTNTHTIYKRKTLKNDSVENSNASLTRK